MQIQQGIETLRSAAPSLVNTLGMGQVQGFSPSRTTSTSSTTGTTTTTTTAPITTSSVPAPAPAPTTAASAAATAPTNPSADLFSEVINNF